jgi:branched-subunit amino acid transport protein
MSRAAALTLMAALGVLLPKVLPVLVLPERLPAVLGRPIAALPVATLGAFTAILVTDVAGRSLNAAPILLALAAVAVATAVVRRTTVSLLVGFAAVAALHAAGRL